MSSASITDIFNQYTANKYFSTTKIDDLLTYFRDQKDPVCQANIVPLLRMTRKFRNLADPGPLFNTVRNNLQNPQELIYALSEIEQVFKETLQKAENLPGLMPVLAYCKESILNALQELSPEDPLVKIYNTGGI